MPDDVTIPRKFFEALWAIRIPGEARQVFDFIFINRNAPIKTISSATGLKKSNVLRSIAKLTTMNIIIQKDNAVIQTDNDIGDLWLIQDNPIFWKSLSKKITQSSPSPLSLIKKKEKSPTPPIRKKKLNLSPSSLQNNLPSVNEHSLKNFSDGSEVLVPDSSSPPQVPGRPPPPGGNPGINKMLIALKARIKISAFVDSSIERKMAKHCLTLFGKLGKEEFLRRLDYLLADDFHHKNCNKIKYVYNNIKGFIEPNTESTTAFIS